MENKTGRHHKGQCETKRMQCNPLLWLWTVDIKLTRLCVYWQLQHLDLVVYASEVSDKLSLSLVSSTQFVSCLVCFFLSTFPSILHPLHNLFRAMWKLPITRKTIIAICELGICEKTEAPNKFHAEMWLNTSEGSKRFPQDQCNCESFRWRTFQTGHWPVTGGGGGRRW